MEPSGLETVAERIRHVQSNIRRAAERAGRQAADIRLVGVTKTVPVDHIREGIEAGLTILGENRLQEALPKMTALQGTPARWHFIGHVQRRKARSVVGVFDLVHSVDSVELAQEIDRRAADAGMRQAVLLEVNIGGEPTKSGFRTEDLLTSAPVLAAFPHIEVKGLMAIPPPTMDSEQARPYFRQLRKLAATVANLKLPGMTMDELSMGMSNDYEVAIEEGATIVRVGTAIFGVRHV